MRCAKERKEQIYDGFLVSSAAHFSFAHHRRATMRNSLFSPRLVRSVISRSRTNIVTRAIEVSAADLHRRLRADDSTGAYARDLSRLDTISRHAGRRAIYASCNAGIHVTPVFLSWATLQCRVARCNRRAYRHRD